jgi:hypothetical protein
MDSFTPRAMLLARRMVRELINCSKDKSLADFDFV